MIEAVSPTAHVQRAYNLYSLFYGTLWAPLEKKARIMALDRVSVQPQERILEVAVGPGLTFLEILKRVDRENIVYGVDLSPRMIEVTHRRISSSGYLNFNLKQADARCLPFLNDQFDVLYNSYMLDLIPLGDMQVVLSEFRRVLKPSGRLVLVNLSKESSETWTLWERLYKVTPSTLIPYIFGSCRPVLMEDQVREAGFNGVRREFIRQFPSSEIVIARK